ncbi:MAG: phosphatidate cytidylyltransferase [Chloroflexota bacterium]
MSPDQIAAAVLVLAATVGLVAAVLFAVVRRGQNNRVIGRTVLARAASYAMLAGALAVAVLVGVAGLTILLGTIAAVALAEWCRLTSLPQRHLVSLEVSNVAIFGLIATRGPAASDVLVGGLVLLAVSLPVAWPDTSRAIGDFGLAAVGLIVISVMLVHGVALVVDRGPAGAALVAAVAVGCATSDVGAYLIGRRFGRTLLAPSLSPAKTRAGLVGNVVGAAVGVALLVPALVPTFGLTTLVLLVGLIPFGAVWGDLLESAAKREFEVKDTGTWLPGFGGILDRVDSLLLALPLTYWVVRIALPVGG